MELRQIVAYGLIALLAAFVGVLVLWLRHNAPHKAAERDRRREREAHERRMAERAHGEG